MPSPFDRVIFPDLELAVPDQPAPYHNALYRLFPDEPSAIDRYFADIDRADRWLQRRLKTSFFPPLVAGVARLAGRAPRSELTTQQYLDRHIRDPRLQALLTYP